MRIPLPQQELKTRLVKEGLISEDRFDVLSREAERKNQNVLDVLISQGVVDEAYLEQLIASALGVELAMLDARDVDANTVRRLPEDVARQRQVIAFAEEAGGVFDVAMADPSDLETMGFLSQHLKGRIRPFLATAADLKRGFSIYGFQSAQDFKRAIEEQIQASLISQSKTIEESAAELPIVAIVENLISYAASLRASDIHLEILEDNTLVRYRVDGILYEIMRVPKVIHPALVARLKLLAGLKIDEHMKPQDGRFRYQIANQVVDIRIAVMPTFYAEKIEMRLLETTQKPISLEELGLMPEDSRRVRRNLERPYGMILSTGPTGSGKTTTLYAFMNILNKPEVNIVSIEDPIEYNIRYVNQTQINPAAGLTFASALRAFLRQDPNVVMVGEIRDSETAEIAVQAALTGHLILSSLHTNDAPTAVPRLFDLKVPPFLVSSVLNLIVAQRLVRRICQVCVYSYRASPDLESVVSDQLRRMGIKNANHRRAPKILYRGKGCSSCGHTGYRGRVAIFEVLEISDKIKEVIQSPGFTTVNLRDEALKEGMKSMLEDGLAKVELAVTTIEEVLRVIRE